LRLERLVAAIRAPQTHEFQFTANLGEEDYGGLGNADIDHLLFEAADHEILQILNVLQMPRDNFSRTRTAHSHLGDGPIARN
jgi:hypothetical protein